MEKGGSWKACLEWKPTGENQESLMMRLVSGLRHWGWYFLVGEAMCTFSAGARNGVFPVKESSAGSVTDNS